LLDSIQSVARSIDTVRGRFEDNSTPISGNAVLALNETMSHATVQTIECTIQTKARPANRIGWRDASNQARASLQ
jgi:hypothetical protein